MDALRQQIASNFTGFMLVGLGIACVVYGGHSGNATLSKIGEGMIPSAMIALHVTRSEVSLGK